MNKKSGEMSLVIATILLLVISFSAGGAIYFYNEGQKEEIKQTEDDNSKKITKEENTTNNKEIELIKAEDLIEAGKEEEKTVIINQELNSLSMFEVEWVSRVDLKDAQPVSDMNRIGDFDYIDNLGVSVPCKLFYKAGRVISGIHSGKDIFVGIQEEEMSYNLLKYYVHDSLKSSKILHETNYENKKGIFNIPESISFPEYGSLVKLEMNTYYNRDVKNLTNRILFEDAKLGRFYEQCIGCLNGFFILPDHTSAHYNLDFYFQNKENGVLSLLFSNNKTNDEQYSLHPIVYTDNSIEDRLKIAGTTDLGEYLYEIKDENDQMLKDLYNNRSTYAVMSNTENPGQNKYSYQEFLNYHPMIFWKDPFGRYIKFTNRRFDVVAEKGKPVIYLYPEEKINLNVRVEPNGGFTKTIPDYPAGGWNVTSYPNGKIVDLSDGSEYPYLFWSGLAFDYPTINEGWVVKTRDLKKFFEEKLSILGMNQSEISDYNEYWLEVLSKKPYYLISFVEQKEIDELSPLFIEPKKPDSVIRILMSAKGLSGPEKIKEQILPKTPERKGFVVVEWGGAVLP